MDMLTSPQRKATNDAFRLLHTANITPDAILDLYLSFVAETPVGGSTDLDLQSGIEPSIAIKKALYVAPNAAYFNDLELSLRFNQVTRVSYATALVDHPEGAVIEYPEAGKAPGEAIAHRFAVDPSNFVHPKDNIQYSLGDQHGGHENIVCYLLRDSSTNIPLRCKKITYACCGTKLCEFANIGEKSHTIAALNTVEFQKPWSAQREVFCKTLALFTALKEQGCAFQSECPRPDELSDSDSITSDTSTTSKPNKLCKGRIILCSDVDGKTVLRCEHWHRNRRDHLRLRDLNEYDLQYLSALLQNDQTTSRTIEEKARRDGYGPLVPCTVMAPASAKRQYCSEWHRLLNGELERGELHRDVKCNVLFDIYMPYEVDLSRNRQILIVCRNSHSHPPPAPTKTPPLYQSILESLLLGLNWKLADATARRIMLDSGFITGLRLQLGWAHSQDPVLANLHPSFVNVDHVKRIILELRDRYFPSGTGFSGVRDLRIQQSLSAAETCYVRCVEEVMLNNKESCRIVICMTPIMSKYLMSAKRLTIDTSFKRVYNWEEFEIESWHDNAQRSLVVCRAFTTSQSAQAHFELFKRIFEIAEIDTAAQVCFRHIHGEGYETFVADSHKGQGLGLGMFCQWLCRDIHRPCSDELNRNLSQLDPYEHLKHFFRICIVHFKRNIYQLRNNVSPEVYDAMLSLASVEPLPNLQAVFNKIRKGGKKSASWLDDKLIGTKFALPAIYWPESKIPLEIWKASPATTNGNEQAHRNVNRDGINLTLLAGVMRGMQYDIRVFHSVGGIAETGVHIRDEPATHHNRKLRSVARKVNAQQRQLNAVDEKIEQIKEKVKKAKKFIIQSAARYRIEKLNGQKYGPASRKLRRLGAEVNKVRLTASQLQNKGSGRVAIDLDDIDIPVVDMLDHETTDATTTPHYDTMAHSTYDADAEDLETDNKQLLSNRTSQQMGTNMIFKYYVPAAGGEGGHWRT